MIDMSYQLFKKYVSKFDSTYNKKLLRDILAEKNRKYLSSGIYGTLMNVNIIKF